MAETGDGRGHERDRNEYGRPENQRPRDRTGRPLAYDTDETELAREWDYETVEEALDIGRRLWDSGRYFEAHECLEDVWHHAADGDEDFWQGVIQVAVACVHHQRDNPAGVVATLEKAGARLRGYPDAHHGIDVAELIAFCHDAAAAVSDADSCVEIGYPELPVTDGGPWFERGPGATPLTREPPWREAARAEQEADSRPSGDDPEEGADRG